MPTLLPRPPRLEAKKRSFFDILLNTFMVVSALVLTFAVLQREERFALGQADGPPDAIEQTMAKNPALASDSLIAPD